MNWNQTWKERMHKNQSCRGNQECASIWTSEEKAREFWKAACENQARYCPIIEKISAGCPGTVLDIGGGPGTLALPLAERGCHVTMIEPASGMITVLKENMESLGVSTIYPIHARWEEIRVEDLNGPFDAVVSCYSLGMPDIAEAVRKMEQVCTGTVYLIWFAGITPWERVMQTLWPYYHDIPYESGPKSDLLFNVLYEMGIYPEISVYRESPVLEHAISADLVQDYAQRLNIPRGSDTRHIEEYFSTLPCTPEGRELQGELVTMIFSWSSRQEKRSG